MPPDLDVPPEVQDQMGRVKAVEAQLQSHALHQFGDPANLLKRHNRIAKLHEDIDSRRSKLNRYSQRYWQEFLNLMEILEYFGCLERVETAIEPEATTPETAETPSGEQWQATPIGQIAAAIRGDNELWLGLALASGELDSLDPHHLAAACSALVTEVSRPDNWTHYDLSSEVLEALGGLRRIRRELFKLQHRYQVALPVWLETEWIGLVEQWALGIEWTELVSHTSLDEGDVVRILRRTVDFLSQIPHVPHLPSDLQKNANRAIQLIDRFPVNEEVD